MKRFASSVVLLALLTGSAAAANLELPAFTGDGAVHKHVTSLREARFRYVVEQQQDFSCGAAALATLLRYAFYQPITEQDIIVGMMATSNQEVVRQQGFSMLDMKRYVNTRGLRASGFVAGLDKLPALRIPAIVMLDINGYKHFVVLKVANKESVFVADPALGNRRIAMEDFARQWNGVLLAVAGPGYHPDSPLRAVPTVLSARNNINTMQPVSPVDLIEYGFLYSDFF